MPSIAISEPDFTRIKWLLEFHENRELEYELERADIINCIMVPPTLVTLDSKVSYVDHTENIQKTSLLVLPECPEDQDEVISVLSPIGTALLGLEVGDKITWRIKNRKRILEVVDLPFQPETSGNLHPLTFHNEFHHQARNGLDSFS